MSKVKLFKEVKRGPKKQRENSYYNGKQRIYYEYVIVEKEKSESWIKKGYHQGLPTDKPQAATAQVEDNGTIDSQASNTPASA